MSRPATPLEAIGIDVGGTKTAAVRIAADGSVLAGARRLTPYGAETEFVQTIVEIATELRTEAVTTIGIGVPGLVDASTGELAFAPRPELHRVPVRGLVSDALGLPVTINNDVHVAAWAEYRLGAGRGHDHMMLIAIGTGVGCGVVSAGRLLHGAHGFAAELWHLILHPGSEEHFEEVVTGPVIAELGRRAARLDPASKLALLAGGPDRVTGESVTAAARDGDPSAIEILANVGASLGIGIASAINIFDPSLVVVGGGPSEAGDLLLEPAREACRTQIHAHQDRPSVPIVAAELGNGAGALGAALLALEDSGLSGIRLQPTPSCSELGRSGRADARRRRAQA